MNMDYDAILKAVAEDTKDTDLGLEVAVPGRLTLQRRRSCGRSSWLPPDPAGAAADGGPVLRRQLRGVPPARPIYDPLSKR